MIRIDKFLTDNTMLTRRDAKSRILAGAVSVNGTVLKNADEKISESDLVFLDGVRVQELSSSILLLNKPAGYVTAAADKESKTVFELLPPVYKKAGFQPVGRLDKETEGLLLFTNDGALLHRLISPNHEVGKIYYAEHDGEAQEADIEAFLRGITLEDGTLCRPARLVPAGSGKSFVTVSEGKYHQVRRMMASRGLYVRYLRREQEGSVRLGELPCGSFRILTEEERTALYNM